MKNQFGKLFIAVLTLGTVSAFGVYRPGWERPILRAEMTEQDSLGHEVGLHLEKTLVMNRQDGAAQPTSFTFTEEQRVYCVVAPCPPIRHTDEFKIINRAKGGCGSTTYTAVEVNNHGRSLARTFDGYRPQNARLRRLQTLSLGNQARYRSPRCAPVVRQSATRCDDPVSLTAVVAKAKTAA